MNINKFLTAFVVLIFSSNLSYSQIPGFGGVRYIFPTVTLRPRDVCGRSNCKPGQSNGVLLHFTRNLFAPEINDTITEEEVVLSVIGRTMEEGDTSGSTPIPCSARGMSPFTTKDITKLGINGYKVKFVKKKVLDLNINAAVEANMKEIIRVETSPIKLRAAEAKFKSAYERINKKELTVNAIYTEWGLKADVLNLIRAKNDKYKECRDFLSSNTNRLITAIGLVSYDLTYQENSVSKLANTIQSELETELGIKGGFSFTFKKEVTRDILAEIESGYSIPVWEHSRERLRL
jgi:hypothetical protein